MASTLFAGDAVDAKGAAEDSTLLVAGHEGVERLGQYLSMFFSKVSRIARLQGFDDAGNVMFYAIGLNNSGPCKSLPQSMDVVIGLTNSSLVFEKRLRIEGTFLADTYMVTLSPSREDVDIVMVPARLLAQKVLATTTSESNQGIEGSDLEEAVMLGAVLPVGLEYPTVRDLLRSFAGVPASLVHVLMRATYEGYDWVQERHMRGKSTNKVLKG